MYRDNALGARSHVTLRMAEQSFREEVICMDSPVPAERAASQSSDDRLSSLFFLCQQLNAERDLPRLLDLMAREVARLLTAERAFSCGIAPPTNCGPWWRSKASRYALMHVVGLRGQWYKQASLSMFPTCVRTPAFIQPLMPALDFEHANILAVPLRNHAGEITGAF
jgi:hypothetical protein